MDETENTNVENFAQALCESALGAGSWQFAKQIPRLRTRYMRRAAVGVVWLSTCARAAGYSPEDLPGVHTETASVEDFREALRGGAERAQALKDENERLRSVVRSMEKDTTILAGIMSEAWPGKAFPGTYPTARDTVDSLRRGGCVDSCKAAIEYLNSRTTTARDKPLDYRIRELDHDLSLTKVEASRHRNEREATLSVLRTYGVQPSSAHEALDKTVLAALSSLDATIAQQRSASNVARETDKARLNECRVALLAAAKLLWPDTEPSVCPTAEQLTEGIRKAIEDAVGAAIAGGRGV